MAAMRFFPSWRDLIFRRRVPLACALIFGGVSPFSLALAAGVQTAETTIWTLEGLDKISGLSPVVEGAPKRIRVPELGAALEFDGKADGVVLPVNPLEGQAQFTVEILFFPSVAGAPEQRFFHVQDEGGRRALIELRLNAEGQWWLDTFLKPATTPGMVLIDPKKTHRAGQWCWAALRYDGKRMASFVNGEKELEADFAFDPMGSGQTSLGMRLNRVAWFKGSIREVRFHREALAPEKLQHWP